MDASIPQLRNAQLFYVQPDLKEAKLHSWNVAFQRQLPWNLVGEVAYVGNVGRGIVVPDCNINAGMVLGADNAGRPLLPALRPHRERPLVAPDDTSYNSLQAKLDRRFKNGFLVTTSYTLSRRDQLRGRDRHRDAGRLERSKGRPDFDRTHAFASSFIWDLPFFKQGKSALRLDPRRLAVQRHLHRVLRHPDQLHGLRAPRCGAPGNTQRPNVNGDARGLRRHRPGPAVLRHVGLLGARRRTPGAT